MIAERMANSVDPDQMPHFVASDKDLHCLLRHVCPKTVNTVLFVHSCFVIIPAKVMGSTPVNPCHVE